MRSQRAKLLPNVKEPRQKKKSARRGLSSIMSASLLGQQSYKVVLLGEGRVGKTSLVLRFCRDTFVDGQPPTIQASCLERALRLGDKTVNLVVWDTAGQERFHALGPIYYRDADAALLVYDITDTDSFKRVQGWVRELRKMVRNTSACNQPALCLHLPASLSCAALGRSAPCVGPEIARARRATPSAACRRPSVFLPCSPLRRLCAASQVGGDIILTIAGNKLDLERQRVVSKQEAAAYAESVGALYFETSAKLGKGIDDTFTTMGKRLLQARGGGGASGGSSSKRGSKRTPMVLIDDEMPGSSSSGKSSGCC